MRIILLKDVSGVGQRGDVKEVSDGYALNFLFPRKLAEHATPKKIEEHATWAKAIEDARVKREQEGAATAARLQGVHITIQARANKLGKLYEQITPEIVVSRIQQEYGVVISPEAIKFPESVRKVGDSTVHIRLGASSVLLKIQIQAKNT